MVETALTFEQLMMGLSRERDHDSLVPELVNAHNDKIEAMVAALIGADTTKLSGLHKVFSALPQQSQTALIDAILGSDTSLATHAAQAAAKLDTIGIDIAMSVIENPDPALAGRGAEILRQMGFSAVPHLHERLKAENPSKRALAVLIELDPDAVNFFEGALEDMLSTQDQTLSRYAIDAASSIGDYALPILLKLIGSADPFQQQNATNALIQIGEPIVPELVDELDNPNSIIQQNVIRALKEIGLPAVPALKDALDSDSQLIKQNATAVLSTLTTGSRKRLFSRLKRRS